MLYVVPVVAGAMPTGSQLMAACVAVLSALPLCSGGELRPADFDREPRAAGGEKIRRDCDGWYW